MTYTYTREELVAMLERSIELLNQGAALLKAQDREIETLKAELRRLSPCDPDCREHDHFVDGADMPREEEARG